MRKIIYITTIVLVLASCASDKLVAPPEAQYGSIRGVVKDPRTMSPLQNVQVYSVPGSGIVLTDTMGAYALENITPGNYDVKASYRNSNFAGYSSLPVKVQPNLPTVADMILKVGSAKNGTIAGLVLDGKGMPVQGVTITSEPETVTEVSNEKGEFLIIDVPVGDITLYAATNTLYGLAKLNIERDAIRNVVIKLYPQDLRKGWVDGLVTSKKEPVPGARVQLVDLGIETTTNDSGHYHFTNVPPGRHTICVTMETFAKRFYLIDVIAGEGTERNVALIAALTIPTENLELFLPMDGGISDNSPKEHKMVEIAKNKFTADHLGRADQALECNGSNGIITEDGALMNYKTMTMGAWLYIPTSSTLNQLIIGKSPHPSGDGYYVVLENSSLLFLHTLNAFAKVSRTEMKAGIFPRDKWFWIGFVIDGKGGGYVTINGTVTASIPPVGGITSNTAEFAVGNLSTVVNTSGLIGKIDHVVVYSAYKSIQELQQIMETE